MSGPIASRTFHRVSANGLREVVDFDDLLLGDVFIIDDDGVVLAGVWRVTGRLGDAIQSDPVDDAARAIVAAHEQKKASAPARYEVLPKRRLLTMLGHDIDVIDVDLEHAECWAIVAVDSGAMLAVADERPVAEALAAGMAALEAVEAMRAEREACRMAACHALGTDSETLEEAVLELVAGHDSAIKRVLSIGRVLHDSRSDVEVATVEDELVADAVLADIAADIRAAGRAVAS